MDWKVNDFGLIKLSQVELTAGHISRIAGCQTSNLDLESSDYSRIMQARHMNANSSFCCWTT